MTARHGHNLLAWRRSRNLTQAQVAEGCGYDRSYYSRIENGKRGYDQELIEKLADFYNCSVADLISVDPASPHELYAIARRLRPEDVIRLTEIARTLETVSGDLAEPTPPTELTLHDRKRAYSDR